MKTWKQIHTGWHTEKPRKQRRAHTGRKLTKSQLPSVFHVWTFSPLTINYWHYCSLHFTGEEIKSQSGLVIYLRSHSQQVVKAESALSIGLPYGNAVHHHFTMSLYWELWQKSNVVTKVNRKEMPVCSTAVIRLKNYLKQ